MPHPARRAAAARSRPRARRAVPLALAPLLAGPLLAVAPASASTEPDGPPPRFVPSGARAVLHGSGEQAPQGLVAPRRSSVRAAGSPGAADFEVTYSGFSSEQRDAFQAAVDTWSRLLDSPVPIRIDARITSLPPGVLGAAGPTGFVVDDEDGRYGPEDSLVPVALANAITGQDLAPQDADIDAEFASDPTLFSYGPDPEPGRYDFTTVVLHEIGHGLGFTGAMEVLVDGRGQARGYWNPGTTQPRPLVFDRSTAAVADDGSSVPLLSLQRGSAALARALTAGRSVWTGEHATAANGGSPVELYTPDPWEPGSSYSHLDEEAYPTGSADSLMTPTIDLGEVVRDPGSVALGMLQDMGWGADSSPLRLSGPSSVAAGGAVPVTGVAPPGSTVRIFFKRRGQTQGTPGALPGYSLQRELVAAADGSFATSYAGVDDHRYYATAGDELVSQGVLTQVRPTFTSRLRQEATRGSTVLLTGRGLPSTTIALRFQRRDGSVVSRRVSTDRYGRWSRSLQLGEDYLVGLAGANGQQSAEQVLLAVRR